MLRFTLFVLLVGGVVGVKLTAKMHSQWKQFKSTHNKNYKGEHEEARKQVFAKNVIDIEEHNLRADSGLETYYQGINQFTDMSQEEFENTMLVPQTAQRMKYNRNHKYFEYDPSLKVPSHFDARYNRLVTPVKNQGRCGSCWAFAVVASVEIAWAKAYGEWKLFSEKQLIDCPDEKKYRAAKCKNGVANLAIDYIYDNGGINTEDCYPLPYTPKNASICYYNPNCPPRARVTVGIIPNMNEETIKQVVYKHGHAIAPIMFSTGLQYYENGVYITPCITEKQNEINHFVVIVGYATDDEGRDYWLAKNSHGQHWGEGGYLRILRNRNLCNVESSVFYSVLV